VKEINNTPINTADSPIKNSEPKHQKTQNKTHFSYLTKKENPRKEKRR